MDAVVCSFVLCSVADQDVTLAWIRRVLRPDGRLVFAEHVAAEKGTWLRRGQGIAAPLARCRPHRETARAIHNAGFTVVDLHRFDVPGPFGVRVPHIVGSADLNWKGHTA